MKTKSRVGAVIGLLASLVLPVVAGVFVSRGLGIDILSHDIALAFTVIASYVCGAGFVLGHYPMLILRVRIGLFISLMSIAGISAAILVAPSSDRAALIALVVFAVVSSLPLVMFGLHNILWSMGRAAARKPAAPATA